MRVVKFSIGFGPRIWHKQPKDSPTTFQVALIPFLAYVQIAGMNPYEEQDPKDKGSYANASLWARVVTITAGPLANYLFASVLFFFALVVGVTTADEGSMKIVPSPDGPAARAGLVENGKVVGRSTGPRSTTGASCRRPSALTPATRSTSRSTALGRRSTFR